jgi:hypothetical protein
MTRTIQPRASTLELLALLYQYDQSIPKLQEWWIERRSSWRPSSLTPTHFVALSRALAKPNKLPREPSEGDWLPERLLDWLVSPNLSKPTLSKNIGYLQALSGILPLQFQQRLERASLDIGTRSSKGQPSANPRL